VPLSPDRLPRQAGGPAEKDFREWEWEWNEIRVTKAERNFISEQKGQGQLHGTMLSKRTQPRVDREGENR
jgi:hypothetical protein